MNNKPSFYLQVYAVVRQIPKGKVTSYGRIANMLGHPNAARAVGYALHALDETNADVPWQRVINSQGGISIVSCDHTINEQAELLRAEGVVVSEALRVDLKQYLWEGLHFWEIEDILGNQPVAAV